MSLVVSVSAPNPVALSASTVLVTVTGLAIAVHQGVLRCVRMALRAVGLPTVVDASQPAFIVLFRCNRLEVRRPYAITDAAEMVEAQGSDRAKRFFVSPTVSTNGSVVLSTSDAELTISSRGCSARPNPTCPQLRSVFGHWPVLIDLRPKAFGYGLFHGNRLYPSIAPLTVEIQGVI